MKSFPHGIHLQEYKEQTNKLPIQRFEFSPYYVLLLNQQIGKASIPIVKEGDEVQRGDKIAKANGDFSSPLHAPVTGKVIKLGLSLDMNGKMQESIIIEPYPASSQIHRVKEIADPLQYSPEELIEQIQEIGMVGLGGAAFPTHLKLKSSLAKGVDTLLVNGCECEPYLTADHRMMLEKPKEIIEGIRILLQILGAKQAVIAIEENKADAALTLQGEIASADPISIEILQTKYPQGAEKLLIKGIFKQEIPAGGLPADLGFMVSNVTSLYEIGKLLPKKQGIIERVISISGDGIQKPGNYLIPIGTPLEFILEALEPTTKLPKVIFGGPMMGKSVSCLQTPTTKGVTGMVISKGENSAPQAAPLSCIRCAECLKVCPLYLNPSEMGRLAEQRQFDLLETRFHLKSCFECGCCAWVCPSRIPLTQLFKMAKNQIQRQQQQQKNQNSNSVT